MVIGDGGRRGGVEIVVICDAHLMLDAQYFTRI